LHIFLYLLLIAQLYIQPKRQGRIQSGVGGHNPPIVDWVAIFTDKNRLCWTLRRKGV